MPNSPSRHSIDRFFWALCLNAVLLGMILVALVYRDRAVPIFGSVAMGQVEQGVPGASGANAAGSLPGQMVVMPGQLSPNVWGCYLLDNSRQTLCVYEYLHNEGLHLVAARDVSHDRVLKDYNTAPSPAEIEALGKVPQGSARVLESKSSGGGQ